MADRKERRLEDKEVDEKPTDLERNDARSTATLTKNDQRKSILLTVERG